MSSVMLSSSGLSIDGVAVDVRGKLAIRELIERLGPEVARRAHGVTGTGRVAHWLESGIVLVSQLDEAELVEIYVCFEPGWGRFSEHASDQRPFKGQVVCVGKDIRGGESEREIWGIPGVHGYSKYPSVDDGDVHVVFVMERRLGRFGKKTGARRLVGLSALWGGVKPFPPRVPTNPR